MDAEDRVPPRRSHARLSGLRLRHRGREAEHRGLAGDAYQEEIGFSNTEQTCIEVTCKVLARPSSFVASPRGNSNEVGVHSLQRPHVSPSLSLLNIEMFTTRSLLTS